MGSFAPPRISALADSNDGFGPGAALSHSVSSVTVTIETEHRVPKPKRLVKDRKLVLLEHQLSVLCLVQAWLLRDRWCNDVELQVRFMGGRS